MRCLSIDPGLSTGYSIFTDGELTECGAFTPGRKVWAPSDFDRVVAEIPQVYPNSGVDPNDLITLAYRLGVILGPIVSGLNAPPLRLVKPREWKQQVPKSVSHPRILAKLTHKEATLCASSCEKLGAKARGDLLDSIGLGQWALLHGIWR